MSNAQQSAQDLEQIRAARARGGLGLLATYVRLSGPGWLQSAITLGGGTLSSSLYLGVLGGFGLLWLQPLMMLFGIVMLCAIGYVALVVEERPFEAIRRRVNPLLAWSWAIASLIASMVWAMPQYALSVGVLQQNLLGGLLGHEGLLARPEGKPYLVAGILLASTAVTWSYGSGGRGVRVYEALLKTMVALIVLCFLGVVLRLAWQGQGLDWGAVRAGLLPDFGRLLHPAAGFEPLLARLDPAARAYWSAELVGSQRDVVVAAAATAVGINMTFLMPYSLRARGWTREFAGLLRFDLLTGMFLPFLLVTGCVVLSAASRFHAQPIPGLVEGEAGVPARIRSEYEALLARRLALSGASWQALPAEDRAQRIASLAEPERQLAATLAKRDAYDLAAALEPLTGKLYAHLLFGLGVLGMALSTITLLMHISGFVLCEMLGRPASGWTHRLGSLLAATGTLGPFLGKAQTFVAVPTSVFGMVVLPIAYWCFFLMMNSRSLLGEARPRGTTRALVNLALLAAALLATTASLWSLWAKLRWLGLGCALLFALATLVAGRRSAAARASPT